MIIQKKRCVWDCGSGDDSKCFSFRNASKESFFIFKKSFLTSAYQNDLKIKKIQNLREHDLHRVPKHTLNIQTLFNLLIRIVGMKSQAIDRCRNYTFFIFRITEA